MIQAFGLTSNPRKAHPPAVDDVSFEARAGHVTVLLGGPGAGKTTALRLMLELQGGRGITYFKGRPLHRIAHPSREVGVLLGDVPGHPARTVRGHLRMLCAASGLPARRADEVLEVVGLVSLREERLGTLSRGMDRRLGLACALLPDPHTLVLDAPTDGLSTREAQWLHGMLRAHARQGGTVLLTTSDPKEAARTADRVVTLEGGKLVADQEARAFARTRLRPRVAVRSPHAARLAALLAKEARTARRSVEVVREGGNRLSVYGSTTADVGETAFRHGILVHQLADEVGDMGPGADSDGSEPAPPTGARTARRDIAGPDSSPADRTSTTRTSAPAEGAAAASPPVEREQGAADIPVAERARTRPSLATPESVAGTEFAVPAGERRRTAGDEASTAGRERTESDVPTVGWPTVESGRRTPERGSAERGRSAVEPTGTGRARSASEPGTAESDLSDSEPSTVELHLPVTEWRAMESGSPTGASACGAPASAEGVPAPDSAATAPGAARQGSASGERQQRIHADDRPVSDRAGSEAFSARETRAGSGGEVRGVSGGDAWEWTQTDGGGRALPGEESGHPSGSAHSETFGTASSHDGRATTGASGNGGKTRHEAAAGGRAAIPTKVISEVDARRSSEAPSGSSTDDSPTPLPATSMPEEPKEGEAARTGTPSGRSASIPASRTRRLPGARTPATTRPQPESASPADGVHPSDPLSPLPPPISVHPAPAPLRPLRYEIRRSSGIGTGFLICGAALVVSVLTAVVLARIGHTPQERLFAAWPRELPLPPAALAAGLLGALAFGDEFCHPALAADRGTVPRRLGLLTAKLLVSGATALLLAFVTVGCNAEVLYLLYGRELTQVPADWLSLTASWFTLVLGCAWAGVLAAGVFRSTSAGLAAVLAVPVLLVPLVHKALQGSGARMAAGLPMRMRELLLLQWPFGGERYLVAALRMFAQPVGGAMTLSLAALLCAYLRTALRTRVR
ncbi:ATP-binding cassette domain-containing protein [Streptomyces sp900105245]|uniref:ATP-binding cassette domain-containing protein n=1 Tax=Streptomyces sp. 900105245 TaxID=3154379 RepID=A0ABV1UCP4_9ACTN